MPGGGLGDAGLEEGPMRYGLASITYNRPCATNTINYGSTLPLAQGVVFDI